MKHWPDALLGLVTSDVCQVSRP